LSDERKRDFQTILISQRGGANPSAGLPSDRHDFATTNRESWNFLRHDIHPTEHSGTQREWTGRRQETKVHIRPTTAPACNPREYNAHCTEPRSDRLAKFSGTGKNILAGEINHFHHGWSKNNNCGHAHESP